MDIPALLTDDINPLNVGTLIQTLQIRESRGPLVCVWRQHSSSLGQEQKRQVDGLAGLPSINTET